MIEHLRSCDFSLSCELPQSRVLGVSPASVPAALPGHGNFATTLKLRDQCAGAYLNPGPHGPGPYHQTVQIIIFIINCYYIHVCAHNKNQNLVYHRVHSAADPLNFSTKLLP